MSDFRGETGAGWETLILRLLMPFSFPYLKELGMSKPSLDTCCVKCYFWWQRRLIGNITTAFCSKAPQIYGFPERNTKAQWLHWANVVGEHGMRKHRTVWGGELIPPSHTWPLSPHQIGWGLWKDFSLSSSGENDIPAALSNSGIRCQCLNPASQSPIITGRLAMWKPTFLALAMNVWKHENEHMSLITAPWTWSSWGWP